MELKPDIQIRKNCDRNRAGSGVRRTGTVLRFIIGMVLFCGVCWLLTRIITLKVVMAIALIAVSVIAMIIVRFAISVVFTIIRWLFIVAVLLLIILVIA